MDKWTIDEEQKKIVFDSIKNDHALVKQWPSFESDVTKNPYYHPKFMRIRKLKGKTAFPPGSHRYKKDPLRVIYIPEGSTQIIYPLEAASVTDVSYKKRTKGK